MTAAPVLGAHPPGLQAVWLRAADGIRLRALLCPVRQARGTVLILPGRTEHAEKFLGTAGTFGQAGYASAVIDWRGQGLSDRLLPDPRKGHVGRFADYQLDLAALRQTVIASDLPAPFFMLGHSMGGCIGLRALIEGLDIAACAFSAPMWGIKVPGDRDRFAAVSARVLAQAGQRARYAPHPATGPVCYAESAVFEGNQLTSDPEEWAALQAELRAHPEVVIAGPTIGWVDAALTECSSLARLASPAIPCLTAVGDQERIVRIPAITTRMAAWPGGTLMQLPGARHELLMETPPLRQRFLSAILSHFGRACD